MNKDYSSLRYERKYVVPIKYDFMLPKFLVTSKMRFAPQYQDRIVNSIYLDTYNLQFFHENVNGLSKRKKFRVRWYGDPNNIKNPVLEVKIKNANLGKKIIYPIKFNQGSDVLNNINEIINVLVKIRTSESFSEILKYLKPNLFVSYTRKYYISKVLDCRLTIDKNIGYKSINFQTNSMRKLYSRNNTIMELKYPSNLNLRELSLLSNFPFRITSNSKYVEGLNSL